MLLPDGVASSHANPLRDGAILLDFLGQFHFHTESFMGTLQINK